MLISVIVPVFNHGGYLEESVMSIMETGNHPLEILIIDDGSTDNSLQVANQLATKYPDRVVVMQHRDGLNHGPGASRNFGIHRSKGDVVCFLDADDIMLPHRFDRAINILENNIGIDAVVDVVGIYFESEKAGDIWGNRPLLYGAGVNIESDKYLEATLLTKTCCVLNLAGLLIKRTLFERTGLYPEDMNLSEDFHLWLRMAACGRFAVGETDKPVVLYRRHEHNTWKPESDPHGSIRDFYVIEDVLKWAKESPYVSRENIQVLRTAFENKFKYCVDMLRKEYNRGELMQLLLAAGKTTPQVLLSKFYFANLLYGLVKH